MKPALFFAALFFVPLSAFPAEWQPVATALLKTEKLGYGGLCGVAVDRDSGDVFLNLSDLGLYRSQDRGASWMPMTTEPRKGRTETPGCLMIDPTGRTKRIVTAFVYGAPIAISDDLGVTFRYLDERSNHIDWCAISWTSPDPQFILALKHEQNGLLIASNDGGQTFREVGKSFISGWVFDDRTAVVAREKTDDGEAGIRRTIDGGKAFDPSGAFEPVGSGSFRTLPKWHDRKLYWLTKQGLIVTTDQGATWSVLSELKDAHYGPVFGRSAKQMFVLTGAGIVESKDGGTTWAEPIAAPRALRDLKGLTWLDYDPVHDSFYLMKMTSDLYRLDRSE